MSPSQAGSQQQASWVCRGELWLLQAQAVWQEEQEEGSGARALPHWQSQGLLQALRQQQHVVEEGPLLACWGRRWW